MRVHKSCVVSKCDLMLFLASSESSDESAHLHRLTLAFVTVPKSHVLLQIAIFVLFTPAARTLVSLLIYTGSLEPRHSTDIPCSGSNGDLLSCKGSSESAHLHRFTLAFLTVPKAYVLPKMEIYVLFKPAV